MVEAIHGDCKEIVPSLAEKGIRADRVIMGLLPAPVDAIPAALTIAKPEGTIYVYEGVEPKDSNTNFEEFTTIANQEGFKTKLINRRLVKAFKPHEYHVVVEIEVKRKVSY